MLPNFIIPGFAKCGTTSMHAYLGRHPDIFMSEPKEPFFFSREHLQDTDRSGYESLFDGVKNEVVIGESSTSYTTPEYCRRSASRIADCIPDCRFLFMVRDPVKRIESDWRMRYRERWGPRDFNEAITNHPRMVESGYYWKIISVYRALFSDEQILIVFLEDLVENPREELTRCFAHLGVDAENELYGTLEAFNTARNRRRPYGFFAPLVGSRLSSRIKERLPSFHMMAKRIATQDPDLPAALEPHVRDTLEHLYRDDTRQLLEYCGKPADFWRVGVDNETSVS